MANIYNRVELFYRENPEAEAIVSQDKVEQYFRRRAWHAASSYDMELEWQLLSGLISYIDRNEIYSFDSLDSMDYEEILLYMKEACPEIPLDEKTIAHAFDTLQEFYKIALPEATDSFYDDLDAARGDCLALKDWQRSQRDGEEAFSSLFDGEDEMSEEYIEKLNQHLDAILARVQKFYRQQKYLDDANRALYLFAGPDRPKEEIQAEQQAFWQSFWDYFLFDYRMISDDDTPFHHFCMAQHAKLNKFEQMIAADFMQARFLVFYVESIEEGCAVCRDLFTEEEMELPLPEELLAHSSRMLFYGHVYLHGAMMLNHISSVPATKKLRRRIKEEILRLFEIYRARFPKASVGEFLAYRGASVRHVIRLMTSFAQLRVVPALRLKHRTVDREELPENFLAAEKRLLSKAACLGLSYDEREIIKDLYRDAVRRSPMSVQLKKRGDTLAAVVLMASMLNGAYFSEAKELLRLFRTTMERVKERFGEIFTSLDCSLFDPRYLSEDGMVNLLCLSPDSGEIG